ncbi:hypothetical protein JHN52_02615 [Streptomyces sp. MBT97]|uniref:hypothetical protein n=1 Tax=Streptomyces sp. MBT97 TaxID=2800411 RepID=UPI00190E5C2D|nr:hypothetical protein [Streptomyces sp. MBT97]MBK3631870.1 hypothetical protein [Streptomyces sp. MBT97]
MDRVSVDFATRPAVLSNAVVRQHRCVLATTCLVVTAGGHLKLDFVVPDGAEAGEAVLRMSVLGAAAPMDAEVNDTPVAKGFELPRTEVTGGVAEYTLTVPGTVLRPGVNELLIRNADPDGDGVLRLRNVSLDAAAQAGRRRQIAADGTGNRVVWHFATERRPLGASAWHPGPGLLFHLDGSESRHDAHDGERPTRLAWRGTDGAESSLAFRSDMSGLQGHFRDVDGSSGELRGTLQERLPCRDDDGVRHFTTEEEHDGVWGSAGRLRLLLDDGGAPVERLTWSNLRGDTASLALPTAVGTPAPGDGETRDVTDQVSRTWASDEFTEWDEGVANLVEKSGKWLAHEDDPELRFTFAAPTSVTEYRLTSANDAPGRDPANWVLEGSLDERNWRVLDSREGESFDRRYETKKYALTQPGTYRVYRLRITANSGAEETQLNAVRFFDGGRQAPDPGVCDFIGYRQRGGAEPVGYRGTRIPAAVPGSGGEAGTDGGELLAGDFSETARSLQDAARLLEQMTRYLQR